LFWLVHGRDFPMPHRFGLLKQSAHGYGMLMNALPVRACMHDGEDVM
jgi:hypothetical protein